MAAPINKQDQETGRIVLFPARKAIARRRQDLGKAKLEESAVADLRQYERDGEPDDYPRRMITNLMAFGFIVVLTLTGIWLADQMAGLRKKQDCALSGQKNCIDINAAALRTK